MSAAEKFWPAVAIGGPDDCWEWTKSRSAAGYGSVTFTVPKIGTRIASRAAWILTHGPIPKGMNVLHRCDNPPCCNPAHLFLGTQADNVRDMHEKGRAFTICPPQGEDHNHAKLTWADVREIRRLYRPRDREFGAHVLARKFGVEPEAVRRLLRGETWKNDPEAEA